MFSSSHLSRRTMLKASGIGVLAITVPLPESAAAGSAPRPPAAYLRDAWLPLVGQSIPVTDGPEFTLASVDDLVRAADDPALRGHAEAFTLTFHGPQSPVLSSAIHELRHPELGGVVLFVTPVGADSGRHSTRPRSIARCGSPSRFDEVDEPLSTATLAVQEPRASYRPAAPASAASLATQRRRVHSRARRRGGKLRVELRFPGGGVQAVGVELRRGGAVVGHGESAVRLGMPSSRSALAARSRAAPTNSC